MPEALSRTVRATLLGRTVMFGSMEQAALEELAGRASQRSYRRGEVIVREGDPGDALFVVVEGLVKVYVTSAGGDEMLLVTLAPPSVFGELPLVDGGSRSASAAALEATTLLTLTRAELLEGLRGDVRLADGLLRSLGSLVRRLTDQAADLVFLDLHGRVAKLLVSIAEKNPPAAGNEWELDLHLTQGEIASMVGGSRQSVNQVLRSFERRGLVELDGRRVVIKQVDRLRRDAS